jgi:hypothetical protein
MNGVAGAAGVGEEGAVGRRYVMSSSSKALRDTGPSGKSGLRNAGQFLFRTLRNFPSHVVAADSAVAETAMAAAEILVRAGSAAAAGRAGWVFVADLKCALPVALPSAVLIASFRSVILETSAAMTVLFMKRSFTVWRSNERLLGGIAERN